MDEKVLFRKNGKGLYTGAQLAEIGKVIHAFYNYLRDSRTVELIWSEKAGYLLFTMDGRRRGQINARAIHNADELVRALLREISREASAGAGPGRLFRRKRPELLRRAGEYMAQLPEYRDCMAAAGVK